MHKIKSETVTVCKGCHYEIGPAGGCATWSCDGVGAYGQEQIDKLTYNLFVSRRPRPEVRKEFKEEG